MTHEPKTCSFCFALKGNNRGKLLLKIEWGWAQVSFSNVQSLRIHLVNSKWRKMAGSYTIVFYFREANSVEVSPTKTSF